MKNFILLFLFFSSLVFPQQNFWGHIFMPFGVDINALAINQNGDIFAGSASDGMFRSNNNGDSWVRINNGLTEFHVLCLSIDSTDGLWAGTGSGLFYSSDNGNSWTLLNNNLPNSPVQSLALNPNGGIFIGLGNPDYGIYRSTDGGSSWIQVSGVGVYSLAVKSNGYIFAGTFSGPYRSTNNGNTWTEIANGFIPDIYGDIDVNTFAIDNSTGYIYAGMLWGTGVFRSANNGNSWSHANNGIGEYSIYSIIVNPNGNIFAASDLYVYRSTNNGGTWTALTVGPNNIIRVSLAANSSGDIFTGTTGGINKEGIYRSTDNGDNWTQINNGLDSHVWVRALSVNKNNSLFAGLKNRGLFRSINNGENWTKINNGIPYNVYNEPLSIAVNSNSYLFASFSNAGGIYRSTNNGNSWVFKSVDNTVVYTITINSNDNIFVGTPIGVYKSTDNGDNWIQLLTQYVQSLSIDNVGNIFAGTSGGIYRSTDSGIDWVQVSTINAVTLAINNSNGSIFAGTSSGIYRSTDFGNNWEEINNGLTNTNVLCLIITSSGSIFTGTDGGGVYYSNNNGNSWVQINNGLSDNNVYCFTINLNGYIYAGTWGEGIFQSLLSTFPIQVLSPNGGEVYVEDSTQEITWIHSDSAVQNVKIEYSLDSCITWNTITPSVNADSGIYSWNVPATASQYCKIRISDAQDSTKFDMSDNFFEIQFPNSVGDNNKSLLSYKLFQNYPNPFNPTTTVKYTIPKEGKVKLKVFDVLGREIVTLVNKEQTKGNYEVEFDGSKLPSGIYFYRLKANEYTTSKKMILLK